MSNSSLLKIVIAEPSVIVRSGLATVLKRLPNLNVHPIEVSAPDALAPCLHMHHPDIVVVNPIFGGWFDLPAFKADNDTVETKYIAMVCSVIDANALKEYDEQFAICDDVDMLAAKINHLLHTEEEDKAFEQEQLSQREKEIITCVVKGMTNKAIADKLYLSIHTVITHRRNIARKLQIHSPAGLTIYAIVNKLVELSEIRDHL